MKNCYKNVSRYTIDSSILSDRKKNYNLRMNRKKGSSFCVNRVDRDAFSDKDASSHRDGTSQHKLFANYASINTQQFQMFPNHQNLLMSPVNK